MVSLSRDLAPARHLMRVRGACRTVALSWLACASACLLLPTLEPSNASAAQQMTMRRHAIATAGSQPYILIIGPDRQLWFTESGASRIGRLDLANGSMREFIVPTAHSQPVGITAGGDGRLWFAEDGTNRIGRLSLNGTFREFDCPTPMAAPDGLYTDAHGDVWFAERLADRLAHISFDGAIHEYAGMSAGAHPLSLTARDGVIWFSEPDGDRLGYFKDGKIRELPLPPGTKPRAMLTHPDGSLWFVATGSHALARVDRNNHLQVFTLPNRRSSPRSLAVAPDGRIWFTEDIVNLIGVMSPTGQLLAEYPVTAPMRGLRGIAVAPDGRVFFAAYDSGDIGELDPGAQ
jgi:virginiamycin B lyase